MATFQTQGYPVPPPGFHFDYRTPPRTSAGAAYGSYGYYSPRNYVHTSTTTTPTSKGHTRRATGDGTYNFTYTSSTPRKSSTRYSTDYYHTSAQSTPQRRDDYVSGSDRKRESTRVPANGASGRERTYSHGKQYPSTREYVVVDDDHYYDRSSQEYLPRYEQYESRPPPYSHRHQRHYESRTDHRYHDQVPLYSAANPESAPRGARPRRASHTNHTSSRPTAQESTPRRPSTAGKPSAKATEDDARRAGIPAGYSYKNWDPAEEPILLLGSVFDAHSLGKWIFDWTVYSYGPTAPICQVAGDLWILLNHLAHDIKSAESKLQSIRSPSKRDLIEEFLDSGERLWQRFNKLLKICENYMWRAARREAGGSSSAKISMGRTAGVEFVDAIFGRDRELERTEKLMTGMRLWSMRFDANCKEILADPLN